MKKLLIALTLLTFILPPVILAQDSTSSIGTKPKPAVQRVQEREAKIASKAAQLKTRLQNFKDQLKAQIVQRVSDNLNKINSNRVAAMNGNLQKMTAILDKLEGKTASSSAAATDARNAIAEAEKAVTVQSEKDYTISVTTENKIRTDTKSVRDKLFKDLQSIKKIMIEAKQSVAKAIAAVKSEGKAR